MRPGTIPKFGVPISINWLLPTEAPKGGPLVHTCFQHFLLTDISAAKADQVRLSDRGEAAAQPVRQETGSTEAVQIQPAVVAEAAQVAEPRVLQTRVELAERAVTDRAVQVAALLIRLRPEAPVVVVVAVRVAAMERRDLLRQISAEA